MNKVNKLIKYSGISYMFISALFITHIPALAFIYLILGLVLLSESSLSVDELQEKRTMLLVLAIISVLLNLVGSILIFLTFDEIKSGKKDNINSPPKKEISNESKKIDLLLKVGVAMIIVAGLLFATTSWNFISNITKVLLLIVMGIIFIGLSYFTEKKLHIEKSTKVYFILGVMFFAITFIGLFYFQIISEWFSYKGEGKLLVYGITTLIIGLFLEVIYLRFKDEECNYLKYACLYIALGYILKFNKLPMMAIILILSLINILNNFLNNKNNSLTKFTGSVSYLFFPLIFMNAEGSKEYLSIIASTVSIIDLLYKLYNSNKNNVESIIEVIIIYLLTFIICTLLENKLLSFALVTLITLVFNLKKFNSNKYVNLTNKIIYYFSVYIIAEIEKYPVNYKLIIIVLSFLTLNIIDNIPKFNLRNKFTEYATPVILYMSIYYIFFSIFKNTDFNSLVVCLIAILLFLVLNRIVPDEKHKSIYMYASFISIAMCCIANSEDSNFYISVFLFAFNLYLYLIVDKKYKFINISTYVLSLINLYIMFNTTMSDILSNILMAAVLLILIILFDNDKINVVNKIAIVLPMLSLGSVLDYKYHSYSVIVYILTLIYLTIYGCNLFIKNKRNKDIVMTILYVYLLLNVIFEESIEYGLFVGITTLISIIAVFNNDDYKYFFYGNLGLTILNVIIKTWGFWTSVPFWLYLLIVGLFIIVFATNKELQKSKAPKPIEEPKKEIKKVKEEKEEIIKPREEKFVIIGEEENNKEEIEEELEVKEELWKFCPGCGRENVNNDKFCINCGTKLTK